jgi:hypothetical protein
MRRSARLNSYAPATGVISANDVMMLRTKLDDAVQQIVHHTVTYTGETPAPHGSIWAY